MPSSEEFVLSSESETPWRAWTPAEVTSRLSTIRTPTGHPIRWAVAGGWAVDLFLGRVTRKHGDIEIVVLNDDVPSVLSAFSGAEWRWDVPFKGRLYPLHSELFECSHQTWLWSQAAQAFVLDVFRDKHDGDTWICRRDQRIRLPWRAVRRVDDTGSPYLTPEMVLLFKAKHSLPKDVADLLATLPSLDLQQREWLLGVLERVHPGHPWLEMI